MTADEIPKQLGLSTFLSKGDFKVIASMISEGESLGVGAYVKYGDAHGHLVATDSRLIWVNKSMFSTNSEVLYYKKVSHIEYKGGLMSGSIKLTVGKKIYEFGDMPKERAKMFVTYVNEQINNPQSKKVNETTTKPNNTYDDLEKLAKLKDQGIITEEEFNKKKKQILGI